MAHQSDTASHLNFLSADNSDHSNVSHNMNSHEVPPSCKYAPQNGAFHTQVTHAAFVNSNNGESTTYNNVYVPANDPQFYAYYLNNFPGPSQHTVAYPSSFTGLPNDYDSGFGREITPCFPPISPEEEAYMNARNRVDASNTSPSSESASSTSQSPELQTQYGRNYLNPDPSGINKVKVEATKNPRKKASKSQRAQIRSSAPTTSNANKSAKISTETDAYANATFQYLPPSFSSIHNHPQNSPYNFHPCNSPNGASSANFASCQTSPAEPKTSPTAPRNNQSSKSSVPDFDFTSGLDGSFNPENTHIFKGAHVTEAQGDDTEGNSSSYCKSNKKSSRKNGQNSKASTNKGANKKCVAQKMASLKLEDLDDEHSDIEDQGIPIGRPVLYTDHLDPIPEDVFGLSSSSTEDKKTFKILCTGCGSTSDELPLGQGTCTTSTKTHDSKSSIKTCKGKTKGNGKRSFNESTSHGSDNVYSDCASRGDKVENSILVEVTREESGSHLCHGCQKPVKDRYVLHVKDHGYWHAECLKCSNCQDNLSSQKTCYVKNEQVFCRQDYNILFGLACVKCSLQFKRDSDWMRVAGQHRYHIACFLCKICKRQLGNNEKYHLVNGTDIYCTNHYRDLVNGDSNDGQQPPKKAKRNRTSYTESQIKFLQERFLIDSNPDGGELEKIAAHISLKKRVVQVWFQNNRARLKKSANNTKGGNNENKSPTGSGVNGATIQDPMTMDWDNSLDPSSLEDQSYPTPPPVHHGMRNGQFMEGPFSSVGGAIADTPLMCLPPGLNAQSSLGHGQPMGDGNASGSSNCGTPRDQVSPNFSDMSANGYHCPAGSSVSVMGNGRDGIEDMSTPAGIINNNNNNNTCTSNNNLTDGSVGGNSTNMSTPLISALRSSVFNSDQHRGSSDPMEGHERQMMMFHDHQQQQLSHHPHQLHNLDPGYGAHLGMYGNLYNMYGSPYDQLNTLPGDHCQGSGSPRDSMRGLFHRSDFPSHQQSNQPRGGHFHNQYFNTNIENGFSNIQRPSPGHPVENDSHSPPASSGNFLGSAASAPPQFRQSPLACYGQGQAQDREVTSPQAFNQGRPSGSSPVPQNRQNGNHVHYGPPDPSTRNGRSYFTDDTDSA